MTLEYTHNDEVAEMLYQKERELHAIIYAKDQEIRVLKDELHREILLDTWHGHRLSVQDTIGSSACW